MNREKNGEKVSRWGFKIRWADYERRFEEENRIEIMRQECEALSVEQSYIESAVSISRKYLTTPFSC